MITRGALMTLPASGAITFANVNTELGFSSTASINLNQASVRSLFGQASGAVDMNTGHGKANAVTINLTIASNVNNYNIFANKGGTYNAGKTTLTLTINAGKSVTDGSGAGYGLTTGSGWTSGDTIAIVNNGFIAGRGGSGGSRGAAHTRVGGSTGGIGMTMNWPVTVTNASGYIFGGGGGGYSTNNTDSSSADGETNGWWNGLQGCPIAASGAGISHGGGGAAFGVAGRQMNGGGGGAYGGLAYDGTVATYSRAGGTAIVRNANTLTWVSGSARVYGAIT